MKQLKSLRRIKIACIILATLLGLGLIALFVDDELDTETFWGLMFIFAVIWSVATMSQIMHDFIEHYFKKNEPEKLERTNDKF